MREEIRRWGPGLLLVSPSIILIAVFVYGLIGWNVEGVAERLAHGGPARPRVGPALAVYRELRADHARGASTCTTSSSSRSTFIVGALLIGADRSRSCSTRASKGEGFFRSVYLFPMAVSFIAAGVVWRWLMNPAPGDRATGLNVVFDKLGLGLPRQPVVPRTRTGACPRWRSRRSGRSPAT